MFLRFISLLLFSVFAVNDSSYALYFRSFTSGNWSAAATWESAPAVGGPWSAAAAAPAYATDNTITILSGHTVRINALTTIDEVVVDPGATLVANASATVTVNDGTGVDLTINGTFVDSLNSASMVFSGSAKWLIIGGANLIKYTGSGSNVWQSAYNGGIANIPATANWILRNVSTSISAGAHPTISTTNGGSQVYYPNLICENYTGATFLTASWASCYFNGNVTYPIIKGNFDIGGAGTNYVDFTSADLNATTGVQVRGDMIVRTGNSYRNNGTGTELQGSLTVDGSWTYSSTAKLDFTSAVAATISGNGLLDIYAMAINKAANVTLNRPVKVNFSMNFNNGKIVSSLANPFILNIGATVNTVSNNTSFVSGPCRKFGNEAFIYPVGKGSDVQPLGISPSPTTPIAATFWTENFNNGCTRNCSANGYSGVNGAWSVANAGTNGNRANGFFVSCAENGNAVNTCGSGCAGNATLHLGATACPSCSICPLGDCGATYDSVLFAGNDPTTDIRVISPPINTLGRNTLTLNFNYIKGGDASADNLTVEYSLDNGVNWIFLANPARTSLLCYPLGRWGTYSVALPGSNLTNLRFAFHWTNNSAAGTGYPFSAAIDDITISAVSLDSYTAEYFHTDPTIVYNNVYNSPLFHVSRMEYWTLTRETGNTKRKVTLYWDGNSGGVTSLPDLRVANFNAASWDDKGNTATTGAIGAGTVTSDSVSGVWNAFTLGSVIPYPGNPLPVELLSFHGEKRGKSVLLQWTTASEKNNDYFTLRKSSNNFNFAELTKVQGAGTTNSISNYSFTDHYPLQGLNYYKLLQTDFDGTTTDEGTVAVRFDNSKTDATIIPDGPGQQINIQFTEATDENLKVDLIDVTGKLILEKDLSAGEAGYTIKTNNIATGIYLIRISSSNGMIYKRFSY